MHTHTHTYIHTQTEVQAYRRDHPLQENIEGPAEALQAQNVVAVCWHVDLVDLTVIQAFSCRVTLQSSRERVALCELLSRVVVCICCVVADLAPTFSLRAISFSLVTSSNSMPKSKHSFCHTTSGGATNVT